MSAAPVACFRRVHGIDFQPFVAFIQRKREFVNLHSPILSTKKENKKKKKEKRARKCVVKEEGVRAEVAEQTQKKVCCLKSKRLRV